jgi:hypothetical protein
MRGAINNDYFANGIHDFQQTPQLRYDRRVAYLMLTKMLVCLELTNGASNNQVEK